MNNKTTTILTTSLLAIVTITMAAYIAYPEIIGYGEAATITIAATLIVFAAYILWDRIRNVSKGFPAKDERLQTINHKAGYYGFIAAIWTAVGAPLLTDILFDYELEGHLVTASVVVVAGLVFAISYLYLARKGN
ncbi:MAG: hypothetical protein NWF05_02470 [Candidatus Bathyarchaeota archaeon]|nr:hypothetical protein [Candidatus Bathyarchaeota archaeon]